MAVAQAAARALHRDHRVEREVKRGAGRGTSRGSVLAAGVGRAARPALDDRVDVRAGDERRARSQEELRQADLGLL